jgi:hypothetical protein
MRSFNLRLLSLFLILALSSCFAQNKSGPNVAAQHSTGMSTLLPEKPEKICGDHLPADSKAYPVSFYPVSVEYSDKNLELVHKHFCEDAIKLKSKSLGKEVVQVASFISQEKAKSFKDKLSQHFSQATIGEPTIVEQPKSDVTDRKVGDKSLNTVESISKAALLSDQQARKLLDLEKSRIIESVHEMGKIKVLVPTYVPPTFTLSSFFIDKNDPIGVRYQLRYKSENSESFEIASFHLAGDGDAFSCDFGRLNHPILGKIHLWYSQRDRGVDGKSLSFPIPYDLSYQGHLSGYYFFSGAVSGKGGKIVSREEAVKIVMSLKPLNPNSNFDSSKITREWISDDKDDFCRRMHETEISDKN